MHAGHLQNILATVYKEGIHVFALYCLKIVKHMLHFCAITITFQKNPGSEVKMVYKKSFYEYLTSDLTPRFEVPRLPAQKQ